MRRTFRMLCGLLIFFAYIYSTSCGGGGSGGGGGAVGTTYYADTDGDGFGDPASSRVLTSAQAGFILDNTDCDDADMLVNPGGVESCDGVDNDCDGQIDESVKSTYYRDGDGDGYGNASSTTQSCTTPAGHVSDQTDCNDGDAAINPGLNEVCDNKDNDCDGQIDESVKSTYYRDGDGDGYGTSNSSTQSCAQPSGYALDSSDCNDGDAAIHPGATELCDNQDNDCDGFVDTGLTQQCYMGPPGTVGIGVCAAGSQSCNGGVWGSCTGQVIPSSEICDGADNDCNGMIDETFDLMTDGDHCGICGNSCPSNSCAPAPTCFNGTCIDAGVVVITEIMIHPSSTDDADGEWIELFNPTAADIDISGWNLYDDVADSHQIATAAPVVIPAGGYAVLAINDDAASNCGVTAVYQYSNFNLSNGLDDEVVLEAGGCEVDRVNYNAIFALQGSAKELDSTMLDAISNDILVNWCDAAAPMTCGDTGTPGGPNITCP